MAAPALPEGLTSAESLWIPDVPRDRVPWPGVWRARIDLVRKLNGIEPDVAIAPAEADRQMDELNDLFRQVMGAPLAYVSIIERIEVLWRFMCASHWVLTEPAGRARFASVQLMKTIIDLGLAELAEFLLDLVFIRYLVETWKPFPRIKHVIERTLQRVVRDPERFTLDAFVRRYSDRSQTWITTLTFGPNHRFLIDPSGPAMVARSLDSQLDPIIVRRRAEWKAAVDTEIERRRKIVVATLQAPLATPLHSRSTASHRAQHAPGRVTDVPVPIDALAELIGSYTSSTSTFKTADTMSDA